MMEEKDENQGLRTQIDCPHCKASQEVGVLQVNNCDTIVCSACGKEVDLTAFNEDYERNKTRNQKEFDKLRKLLGK